MEKFKNSNNLINDLFKRELNASYNPRFIESNTFSRNQIDRLHLECELKGHDGCVNCLEWSNCGNFLASGSDDLKLNIWNPFKKKLVHSIDTKHRGNIFSLKFLPSTNDSLIASGAADRNIFVYDLNKNTNLCEIYAHQNRVKRLVTAQDIPFLFWSCGEDGLVLQHDIRCSSNEITRLLLNYSFKGVSSNYPEAKCIAINQVRNEYLAVGNNDPYARVYDRRMIKLSAFTSRTIQASNSLNNRPSDSVSSSSSKYLFEYNLENELSENMPLTYYVPGHLPKRIFEYRKRMKTLSVTFITFSPSGSELLVNLGGEQLYLFDLNKNDHQLRYDSYKQLLSNSDLIESFDKQTNKDDKQNETEISSENQTKSNQKKSKQKLPLKAEELKSKANSSFEQQNYVEAIEYYNQAIYIAPDSPVLYGNRAATLMKRNWDGDVYMAMLDCYRALSLDRNHLKSHFRLAKCLNDLKWHQESYECLKLFRERFPDYANITTCDNLLNDLQKTLEKLKKQEETKETKSSNASKKARRSSSFPSSSTSESETDSNSDQSENEDNYVDDEEENEEESNEHENEDNKSSNDDENNNRKNIIYKSKPIKRELISTNDECNEENKEILDTNSEKSSKIERKKKKIQKEKNHELNKIKKAQFKKYKKLKENTIDFKSRFCGHCNVATDIKEANFLGSNFICAGSDDGSFFIWDKSTTNVIRVLRGDESIVNCIQPHHSTCILATSGIDPLVRIWSPKYAENENESENDRVVQDVKSASLNNQLQMNSHPFEFLLLNLTQNPQSWGTGSDEPGQQSVACRPS